MNKIVKGFAPATVANLGVGFDVLGLALSQLGDTVSVQWNKKNHNEIIAINGGDNLSKDMNKNCCGKVIEVMQKALKIHQYVDITIEKGYQSGSGLGSSAASSAAAAIAYNALNGSPFSKEELIPFAMQGETIACGNAHADNVAPALLGGVTLILEQEPLDVVSLNYPEDLFLVLLFPEIEIKTEASRAVLRNNFTLKEVSQQSAYLGGFLAAMQSKNYSLMRKSMQDLLVEPSRKMAIPLFDELKAKVMELGAIGCSISGSGPSVFALVKGEKDANHIYQLMNQFYQSHQINSQCFIDQINPRGAYLLNE